MHTPCLQGSGNVPPRGQTHGWRFTPLGALMPHFTITSNFSCSTGLSRYLRMERRAMIVFITSFSYTLCAERVSTQTIFRKVYQVSHILWKKIRKTHELSWKSSNFASWFWKESPVKVHLAVLNWELGCESPTVPQQWTPLWLLSINAIAYLGEKALGSGEKSEDQPFSVKMPLHHDVWCR